MSENNDPVAVPPAPPADPTPDPTPDPRPAPEAPARRTWRERLRGTGGRVYGVRALIAATLAALIVGGVGGAVIHAAVDGPDHDRGGFGRGGFGPGFDRGGPLGERPDGRPGSER